MIGKPVVLWTDAVVWAMLALALVYGSFVARNPALATNWRRVFQDRAALAASVVLALGFLVALADSLHYRRALAPAAGAAKDVPTAYEPFTRSLLDLALERQMEARETTYSEPLDYESFTKETLEVGGQTRRVAQRLLYGGAALADPAHEWAGDVLRRGAFGLAGGALAALGAGALLVGLLARRHRLAWRESLGRVVRDELPTPWRVAWATLAVLLLVAGPAVAWAGHYHVLGTDRTGNDVLYQALKSIRTAFVIGSLSTLGTLPLAVAFGIMAGYFRGWVDELIQYLYTVLSSVPNLLLIAACVLMVQVYLDQHPEMFETGAERADLKLFLLCSILGVTGWAGLCRLLRAETLKLREFEYVQAARAFGVSAWRTMARHVFPNVVHLILISTVLDFSGLVLYEAVLSYVGVGVDPSMNSFGGMINLARSEMSLDPVVWWSFAAAFTFMVTLVLAANLFSDGVRDAFDPRSRALRPRLAPLRK